MGNPLHGDLSPGSQNALPGHKYDLPDTIEDLNLRIRLLRIMRDADEAKDPETPCIFTRVDVAIYLIMPLRSLGWIAHGATRPFKPDFHNAANFWLSFLLKDEEVIREAGRDQLGYDMPQTEDREAGRDQLGYHMPRTEDREFVLERQGHKCLVTGAPEPDVTHIVHPFTLSSSRSSVTAADRFNFAEFIADINPTSLIEHFDDDLDALLFNWNLVALHPEVVRHWRAGRCAFKPVGVVPVVELSPGSELHDEVDVVVEFRWLDTNKLHPLGPANLSLDELLSLLDPASYGREGYTPDEPPMDIASGTRFTMRVIDNDAHAMLRLFDVQWAILRVAAISGATAYPEYIPLDLQHHNDLLLARADLLLDRSDLLLARTP